MLTGVQNRENNNDHTALHLAAINGADQITIQALLNGDANIDEVDREGNTALHHALHHRHFHTALELINCGAQNIKNNEGLAPLHIAAQTGCDDIVKALLDNDADIDEIEVFSECTPLQLALIDNRCSTALELINRGAKSIKELINGNFPLHIAAEKGLDDIIKALLDNNANIDEINNRGETALHSAIERGYVSIALELTNRGAKSVKDDNGEPPLHVAARKGCNDVIKVLLDNNANIDEADRYGNTPLYRSLTDRHYSTALELSKRGAKNIGNYDSTPLHMAAQNGSTDIIKALLDNNANVDEVDQYGSTPLHHALFNVSYPAALALINQGANNIENKKGNTPLKMVATNRFLDRIIDWQKQMLLVVLTHLQEPKPDDNKNKLPSLPNEIIFQILVYCLPNIFSLNERLTIVDSVFELHSSSQAEKANAKPQMPILKKQLEKSNLWSWENVKSAQRQEATLPNDNEHHSPAQSEDAAKKKLMRDTNDETPLAKHRKI